MAYRRHNTVLRLAWAVCCLLPAGAVTSWIEGAEIPLAALQHHRLSPVLKDRVTSTASERTPAPGSDGSEARQPGAVELPPVIVYEPKIPPLNDDIWLTPEALDQKLIRKHLPPFDRNFLNRFTLPLLGVPNSVRARAIEAEEKRLLQLDETEHLIHVLRQADPAEAEKLAEIRNRMFVRESVGASTPSSLRLLRGE